MAKEEKSTAPTIEDCMAQIKALADQHGEMKSMLQEYAKSAVAPKKPDPEAKKDDGASDDDSDNAELKAGLKETREQLSKIMEAFTAFQKNQTALGLKSGKTEGGADGAAEAERVRLAAEKEKNEPKTYLQLMASKKGDAKYKTTHDRHTAVMAEAPEAYAAYIKGFTKDTRRNA